MYSCFHSVGLPKQNLLQAIQLVAESGYAAIELNAETLPWAPAHITPETDKATRNLVAMACRSRSLAIPAVGAHIKMVSADPAARQAAVDFVKGCIDIAKDVESPIIHILSGAREGNIDQSEAWSWFRSAVEETTEYANSQGKVLAIEAIAGHLFHRVDDYHQLKKELPGIPFKVNFDPSHLEVQKENPMRVVDELGGEIVHVHLKDGKGLFPNFEFPPLGEGTINFEGLIEGLTKFGYSGALSVEYEAQAFGYKLSDHEILAGGKAFTDKLIEIGQGGKHDGR